MKYGPITRIGILFAGLALILGFTNMVRDNFIPGLSLACYVGLSLLLVLTYHETGGYEALRNRGRRRGMLPIYILAFFFTSGTTITKFAFNRMPLLNLAVLVCSLSYAALFTIAVIRNNEKFGPDDNWRKIGLVIVASFLGYGFSLTLNNCEITQPTGPYVLSITGKYIETGVRKGVTYHTPHFIVQNWRYSSTIGNNLLIPDRWGSRYPNIEYAGVRDLVSVRVHRRTRYAMGGGG